MFVSTVKKHDFCVTRKINKALLRVYTIVRPNGNDEASFCFRKPEQSAILWMNLATTISAGQFDF
jgi:hypothetical protein